MCLCVLCVASVCDAGTGLGLCQAQFDAFLGLILSDGDEAYRLVCRCVCLHIETFLYSRSMIL